MKAELIDLHLHSYYSDGTQSIREIVDISLKVGLKVISITDHDTIDGIAPARTYLAEKKEDLALISGVELSSKYEKLDVHILGYCFDEKDEKFVKTLDFYKQKREDRAYEIINKLEKLGIGLDIELVKELANGGSIGRPHVARALVKSGVVSSIDAAFSKYLGYYRPAYVPKEEMTPKEAVEHIHEAGGVAVLAHSGRYLTDAMLKKFISFGLDGLEVYHPIHDDSLTYRLLKKAKENSMIITGGSDSHGTAKTDTYIGSVPVPYLYYKKLTEYVEMRRKQ